jgi:DNA-binding transcriptional ArsR family regulator
MGTGMSDDARREPASFQVVSDLGQLTAFTDPRKMQILRILQHQEATVAELAGATGESASNVSGHTQALSDLRLIRVVDQQIEDGHSDDVYRATARVYNLRPDPGNPLQIGASVASASLDSIGREIVASLTTWPDQRLNYEGRRTRMPIRRALEFNERLVELIDEYWGSPGRPVEENRDDPLMALVGFWYRFPESE